MIRIVDEGCGSKKKATDNENKKILNQKCGSKKKTVSTEDVNFDDDPREKYFLWKTGNRVGNTDGYYDLNDALADADDYEATEAEQCIWNDSEAYNNGYDADTCKTVWRRH